jgi:hypothetical protein
LSALGSRGPAFSPGVTAGGASAAGTPGGGLSLRALAFLLLQPARARAKRRKGIQRVRIVVLRKKLVRAGMTWVKEGPAFSRPLFSLKG